MKADGSINQSQQWRIDGLCDRFEAAWNGGARLSIEDVVRDAAESDQSPLAWELVGLEVELRRRDGETPSCQEYVERFPDLRERLPDLFRDVLDVDVALQTALESPPLPDERKRDNWLEQLRQRGIGRYRILDKLGEGGFGTVYSADDPQLQRRVAIKVPRPDKTWKPEQLEEYRREAQILAKFEHENIVRVYDIGQDERFAVYIVSQFIDGIPLSKMVRGFHVEKKYRDIARVTQILARALQYAHEQGIVHRDLKPANVMLRNGDFQVFLMDFGLALRDEDNAAGQVCGTPGYASPEQVSGEGHRIDGRSDLFSLGVILHELLTGRVPFATKPEHQHNGLAAWTSYRDRVRHSDVKPLRQLDPNIPRELERICLKLLERRASDRYSCAADLIEDLTAYIAGVPQTLEHTSDAESMHSVAVAAGVNVAATTPGRAGNAGASPTPGAPATPGTPAITPTPTPPLSDEPVLKIVPKGLRSFDASDQDFFLDLLPGARDRDGLPESIRFWKTRIEATDAENTFAVGVLYGPSGCGKSSLLKAGLLPRLSERVLVVYLEATGNVAESLRDADQRHGVTPPQRTQTGNSTEESLRARIAKLCDLFAESSKTLESALRAVRQGTGVPSRGKVLIVIDQFEQWLHANREQAWTQLAFALRQCDGEHVQCLLLVRDDFWLAISRLLGELEVPLLQGLNCAVADLFDLPHAQRVLSAFGVAYGALPPRAKDWTTEQRQFIEQAVEGLAQEGKVISVRLALFAEMVKSKPWTPTTFKAIGGASGVGVAFLEETFAASTAPMAYRAHQVAVRGALKALLPESGTDIKGHQISRDVLLTASGYATRPRDFETLLHLLDRDLRLITPVETMECGDLSPLSIAAEPLSFPTDETSDKTDQGIGPKKAASPQTKAAASHRTPQSYQLAHDYLVPSIREWLTKKQRETWRGRAELRLEDRSAGWHRTRERRHMPSLFEYTSIVCGVPSRKRTVEQRRMMRAATRHHVVRWGSVLVLLLCMVFGIERHLSERQRVADDKTTNTRISVLGNATADGVPFAIEPLIPLRELAIPKLRALLNDTSASWRDRSHAAYALAKLGDSASSDGIVATILDAVPTAANDESKNMVVAFRDLASARTTRRAGGVSSPVDGTSDTTTTGGLTPPARQGTEALRDITAKIAERTRRIELTDEATRSERMTLKVRYAALALYLGDPSVVSAMCALGPDPSERTAFTLRLKDWPADLSAVRDVLATTTDEPLRSSVVAAIGSFPKETIADFDALSSVLQELFVTAPDGGSHSGLDWTLRQWGVPLPAIPAPELASGVQAFPHYPNESKADKTASAAVVEKRVNPPGKQGGGSSLSRRWHVNSVGMTFVEIPAGKYPIGQINTDQQPNVELTRAVYVSNRELTVAQFLAFANDPRTPADQKPQNWGQIWEQSDKTFSPTDDCPMQMINWYDSVLYCNWLSRQESLTPCYAATGKKLKVKDGGDRDVEIDEWVCDFDANGYRLPTEAEWEVACRSGTKTTWNCGNDDVELRDFAVFIVNSRNRAWPSGTKLPNGLGLFDVHGNVWEWCHDWFGDQVASGRDPRGPGTGSSRGLRGGSWDGTAEDATSAIRRLFARVLRFIVIGVRLAQVPGARKGSVGVSGAA